ncbi:uncharacterized protein LOC141637670 [Silene latifolia]|uniref:uncharacterized protein LOC141637670 n=1 Tax=Silene latifolia TaxID=37657 RepID=UPI003D76D9E3
MKYVPYVPCSKIEPCDLGSTSKSLQETKVKLQAQIRRLKGDVPTRSATGCHGVPREPKPPDLNRGEHHLLRDCHMSSPTLRDKGKTPLLPSFNGENSRAFVSWLYEVECYFKGKYFSEERKLELVVSCLKGSALFWYNALNFARMVKGKGKIRSWFKLEKNMRLKFLPCSTMNELWAKLKTLKQNSLSVHEYARLFEELNFVCVNEVNPFKKIRFFLGLKSEIARKINLEMVHSYGELLGLALYVEEGLARPKNHEVLAKGVSLEVAKTDGKEESLDQGVVPSLNITCPKSKSLEPKVISICGEMINPCSATFESPCCETKTPFKPTHKPTSEEENRHILSHVTINEQTTDLGPRDVQESSKSYGGKLLNEPPSEESTPKRIEPRVKLKPGTIWGKESVHGGPHDSIQVQTQQVRELKSKEKRCEAHILAQGNVNGSSFERRAALPQVFKPNCGLEREGNKTKNQVVPLSKDDQGSHKLNDQDKSSFGGLLFASPTISVPILTNSFGNGATHLLPFTILVYDPGGSHESHLLKCAR